MSLCKQTTTTLSGDYVTSHANSAGRCRLAVFRLAVLEVRFVRAQLEVQSTHERLQLLSGGITVSFNPMF